MERVDRIVKHKLFQQCREQIDLAEQNRIYCKHPLEHSLDVARIAYILNLEEQGPLNKEEIYAMALLHDLGRSEEYTSGKNHHIAGAELAKTILEDCGFVPTEISMICQAIAAHKAIDGAYLFGQEDGQQSKKVDYCKKLLYRADKLSRNCFDCKVSKTCYWKDDMKNHQIKY